MLLLGLSCALLKVTLELSYGKLTGTIPTEIFSFQFLSKWLPVDEWKRCGRSLFLPFLCIESWMDLTTVEQLNLKGNQLVGPAFPNATHLDRLGKKIWNLLCFENHSRKGLMRSRCFCFGNRMSRLDRRYRAFRICSSRCLHFWEGNSVRRLWFGKFRLQLLPMFSGHENN